MSTDPSFSRITDPDIAFGSSSVLDATMVLGGSSGHLDQYGPCGSHDPKIPAWPQRVTHSPGICMTVVGNRNHRHQHRA